MGVFHVFKIVRMVPNRAKHQLCCCYARDVEDHVDYLKNNDPEKFRETQKNFCAAECFLVAKV